MENWAAGQMKEGDSIVLYKYFPVVGPMSEQKLKWFCEGRVLLTPPMYLNDPSEMYYCQEPMTADDCREKLSGAATESAKRSIIENYQIEQAIKGQVDPAFEATRKQAMVSAEVGVLSLTEKPLSRVMWAHYADGHMGFVAGFPHKHMGQEIIDGVSYKFAMGPFGLAVKVNYVESLPAIRRDFNISARLFYTKHSDWSHETEWRVIGYFDVEKMRGREKLSGEPLVVEEAPNMEGKTYYYLKFHPEELQCILLGVRCNSALADRIRAWFSEMPYRHLKIQKVKYDPRSRDIAINGFYL